MVSGIRSRHLVAQVDDPLIDPFGQLIRELEIPETRRPLQFSGIRPKNERRQKWFGESLEMSAR
jgi:hypothetical protein